MTETERPTFSEGIKKTWKEHLGLFLWLALLTIVATLVAYVAGLDIWVVGPVALGLFALTFVLMSAAAVFWMIVGRVTPSDVLRWCGEFESRHRRKVQLAIVANFLLVYALMLWIAFTLPASATLSITIGSDHVEFATRLIFRVGVLAAGVPLASLIWKVITVDPDSFEKL